MPGEEIDRLHRSSSTALERAGINMEILQTVVHRNAHVREYFERGGTVKLIRKGTTWVMYTKQGLTIHSPGNPAYQGELNPDALSAAVGQNKAIDRFARMSPTSLVTQIARRIDPKAIT